MPNHDNNINMRFWQPNRRLKYDMGEYGEEKRKVLKKKENVVMMMVVVGWCSFILLRFLLP